MFNTEAEIKASIEVVENIRPFISRIPHNHINAIYLLREYLKDTCKTYLEIGVYYGGSMITAMQSKYQCKFYGIDFFGSGLNNEYINKASNQLKNADDVLSITKAKIEQLNKNKHEYNLIQGDSQDVEIVSAVKKSIPQGIDMLFIDGGHTSKDVKADFNNYKDLVNVNGIIVFDDYGFITSVKDAVDALDLKNYEIFDRINVCEKNTSLNELIGNKNASFIIKKLR